MDTFDFDQVLSRSGTYSYKWDGMRRQFGTDDVLPMWVADMDFAAPPAVVEALANRAEHGIYGYTYASDTYIDSIIAWLHHRHKWKIDKKWVVLAPGVVPSIALAIHALTETGDKVLLQAPVYPPFFDSIRKNGRQVVVNQLRERDGQYEIDFDDLEKQLQQGVRLMLLCHPHNPVGRAWKRDELQRLAQLAAQYGTRIVTDEIHSDWVFQPHHHVPFAAVDEKAAMLSITCHAPSKTFNLAGLHTSFMIIPDDRLRMKMINMLSKLSLFSQNTFSLTAATAAYNAGGAWLDALKDYVRGNMDLLAAAFKSDGRVHVHMPEATYLLWLDFRKLQLEDEGLRRWMIEEARVGMNEGRTFGPGGEGHLRLNAASPRPLVLQAVERLEKALQKL